jgi:hypothetical protein
MPKGRYCILQYKKEDVVEIVNLIFSGENMRTVIILMAIFFSFKLSEMKLEKKIYELKDDLKKDMGDLKKDIDKNIDERFTAFHTLLKDNDFAHLNRTVKALTFTLEKNEILDPEDKKYIDSHLDEK